MNRQKLYWICQITGWLMYVLYDFVIYSIRYGYDNSLLINAFLTIFFGITITHSYRLIIKRLQWLDLPINMLIPRIVVSVLLLSLSMTIISIPLDYFTVPGIKDDLSSLTVQAYYFLGYIKGFMLWSMIYHTFQYFERSKNNEVEKIRLSSSVKDFESKLLRSQLNPHFVFNALNGIRGLVLENPEKAQQSITQLSRILRNSLLADRHKTVTLQEELKTVQDYLDLEKIRYEDRLQIETDIESTALDVQVPPMMLQTLVENAIKHGVSKPLNGGFIAIDAKRQNGHLHLTIRNTGQLNSTKSGKSESSTGFGLINTHQRLNLIYGENATFAIKQESENVVRAELEIPTNLS